MITVYRILAGLIALGVVLQAAAIAFAWFEVLNQVDSGMVFDSGYESNAGHAVHGIVGITVIPVLALGLLVVSFFARGVPSARRWAGLVFAVVVLQIVLAFVAFGAPLVGALHGVNALVLVGAALRAAWLPRWTTPPGRADEHAAGATSGTVPSV